MCIRDSDNPLGIPDLSRFAPAATTREGLSATLQIFVIMTCLLYTSDAADERSSVDLGGRRIIKKKKYRACTEQRSKLTATK